MVISARLQAAVILFWAAMKTMIAAAIRKTVMKPLVFADKADIGLCIEIVADNGCKSKHADSNGDNVDRPGAELSSDRLLDQWNAIKGAVSLVNACEQQDENRCGTDHQGIYIDRNDLGQALFCRMRYFG